MRRLSTILLATVVMAAGLPVAADEKPRLIVLTDIGGDPDDQQSLVRLLLYANEFEIEGLIASASGTPGELQRDLVQPELIRRMVAAYGSVRPNLLLHHPDYPRAEQMLERIKAGNPHRGVGHLGADDDTEGSRWIMAVVDRPDPRPVNIAIWGGSTELAQALWRVRNDRGTEERERFLAKIRVHDISHQDDTGPWIVKNFPDLFYVLSKARNGQDRREAVFRGMYLGGDEALTSRAWLDAHVRREHGPLGALYPPKTWTDPNPHGALKEGDTPSWLYFLPNGLGDPAHPEWGGWGGRFEHAADGLYRDAADTVDDVTAARATVWRWRPAFQADFQARLDWCVQPRDQANHPPLAGFRQDASRDIIQLTARPGTTVRLDAQGSSDPDGDRLVYSWHTYPEAATYTGKVAISNDASHVAEFQMPADAVGKTVHVILQVTDDGAPPLTRYRRLIVTGLADGG